MGDEINERDLDSIRARIEARNRLRIEARLPSLAVEAEIAKEVAQHKQDRRNADYAEWQKENAIRIERAGRLLLALARKARNDPTWKPSGVLSGSGMWCHLLFNHLEYRLYQRSRRLPVRRREKARSAAPPGVG